MFQRDLLAGKIAYISGGTSGINLGIAKGLASYGARVVVVGRNDEKAEAAARVIIEETGGEALAISADVRDYDAIDESMVRTVELFGKPDIVIAGAAGNFVAPANSITAKGFKTVVDIDLIGTFNVFRAAFDHCRKPGSSFMAITAAQAVCPTPFQAHVGAAKAGINSLLKTLAMEWGPAGIRVNGIMPGPIADTEGMRRIAPTEAATEAIKKRIPLRDYGDKTDVANVAIYLSSPMAKYITGTILDVDGGLQLGDASADCLA